MWNGTARTAAGAEVSILFVASVLPTNIPWVSFYHVPALVGNTCLRAPPVLI
jgi:hypothetical protein